MAGAALSFTDLPNHIPAMYAPGDTNWHRLPVPVGVPAGAASCLALLKSLATAGNTDGAMFFVCENRPSAPANLIDGMSVSAGGQGLVVNYDWNIWVRLTTATDTILADFAF